MKILHVVPTYAPAWRHGGPIRAVHGLCTALARRGHQVSVLTTNVHADGFLDVPLGAPVDLDGVSVTYLPTAWPRRLYRTPALAEAVRSVLGSGDTGGPAAAPGRPAPGAGAEIVHLHSVFLLPTTVAAGIARDRDVPYVLAPRGMLVPELLRRRGSLRKRLWIALFERRNLAGAAAIQVTSRLEAMELASLGLDLAPLALLANGVDLPDWTPCGRAHPEALTVALDSGSASTAASPPYLLFLGRLSWKKGLDTLLAAFARLRVTVPNLRLVLAGPDDEGYQPTLERQAVDLGIASHLEFTGQVEGPRKGELLRQATLLVLPSLNENFGNVALEAMALGTAVVVTPGVGLAEELRAADAGAVAAPSAEGLAEAVQSLLADPARLAALGERGRRLVEERFSWPAIAAATEELYGSILARRGVPAALRVERAP